MIQKEEGYIPFKGFKTWYQKVGECRDGKLPLLVLHGGPGAAHFYLQSLNDLAENGRQVIYYDQLGCGNSPAPSNPDMWCTELWEEELDVVRSALGLDRIHLIGQSWGGMLAMQYAIHKPKGVASMIVASSPASIPLYVKEANRLCDELPPEYAEALKLADQTGDYENELAQKASEMFYERHACRVPMPDFAKPSFEGEPAEPYLVMQGPKEFVVNGKLKDWDVSGRLSEIEIPTLVTSGLMDEVTPLLSKQICDRIPDCEWELFEFSSHLAHIEQREEYMSVIEAFMRKHEQ